MFLLFAVFVSAPDSLCFCFLRFLLQFFAPCVFTLLGAVSAVFLIDFFLFLEV